MKVHESHLIVIINSNINGVIRKKTLGLSVETVMSGARVLLVRIMWVFPKIMVPQNGWFIRENPIKMDDLGTPILGNTHVSIYLFYCSNYPESALKCSDVNLNVHANLIS